MIAGLVAACRAAGLRISAAETLDGVAAAAHIGWQDKGKLKQALAIALAKNEKDKEAFNRCFEKYIALQPPSAPSAQEEDLKQSQQQLADLMRAAQEIKLDKIEIFTQRGLYVRRLVEAAQGPQGSQPSQAAQLSQGSQPSQGPQGSQPSQPSEAAQQALETMARFLVDRQLDIAQGETSFKVRSEVLMDKVFSEADQRDLEIMSYQVKRLAKKLALAASRRQKKDRRGVPDIGRSLRANLRNDGQMINLMWRQRKVNHPRIFALCDVSGSVSQGVRFLLMFLYNLTEVVRSVRAFAFSNRLGEVSTLYKENEFAEAFGQTLRQFGGGSTDYGESFKDFDRLAGNNIDRKSIVIILGDGRSNYGECGAAVLERLSGFAGRVLWLNPESKSLWGSGDSEMPRLAPLCHEVHACQTLRQLTHIIDDVLKVRI